MSTRISPTLVRREADICCTECGHAVSSADATAHWKDHAVLTTTPVSQLPGWSSSVHPELDLRQFFCNGCGHLLDSEISLREDPFLYDVVGIES